MLGYSWQEECRASLVKGYIANCGVCGSLKNAGSLRTITHLLISYGIELPFGLPFELKVDEHYHNTSILALHRIWGCYYL